MSMDRSIEHLADRWWAFVVRGAVTVAVGLITLTTPHGKLGALVYLWGAYAIGDGLFAFLHAARAGSSPARRGWLLTRGVLGLGAGLLVVLVPGISALMLLTIFACWAVLSGVADSGAAFRQSDISTPDWVVGTCGVLSIAFGVLLIVWPFEGAIDFAHFVGAYAIFFGGLMLALGVGIRRFRHRDSGSMPTSGTPRAA